MAKHETEMSPAWRCLRIMWKPWTLPEAAVEVSAWHALVFGGLATEVFVLGFMSGIGVLIDEPFSSWQDIWISICHLPVLFLLFPFSAVAVIEWLISVLGIAFSHVTETKTIQLASLSLLFPALVWLMFAYAQQANSDIWDQSQRIGWLESPVAGFLASCMWFCLIVFAWLVICLWGIRKALRIEAARDTLCAHCRYDLRGSIPAGATHCPECGEAIEAEMVARWCEVLPR